MSRTCVVNWQGLALAAAALIASACNDSPTPVEPEGGAEFAAASAGAAQVIPGRFIITVRDGSALRPWRATIGFSPSTCTPMRSTASRG